MSDEYRQAVQETIEKADAEIRRIGEGSSGIFIAAVACHKGGSSVSFVCGGHVGAENGKDMLMNLPVFLQRAREDADAPPQSDVDVSAHIQ